MAECSSHQGCLHLQSAIDSLPSLNSLELICYLGIGGEQKLISTLRRLCTSRLEHLGILSHLMKPLLEYQPCARMPRLRSLTVHRTSLYQSYPRHVARSRNVDASWAVQLPSLLHITVGEDVLLRQPTAKHTPQLASLTIHGSIDADLSRLAMNATCVRLCLSDNHETNDSIRMDLLAQATQLQQLAVYDERRWKRSSTAAACIFPPLSATCVALPRLVYIEFLDGLTLADLAYILTPSSPPAFAPQLTHLALRVYRRYRAAAAALLLSLPSM